MPQDRIGLAIMALRRRHKFQPAVLVPMVVPLHELLRPCPCFIHAFKRLARVVRPVFAGRNSDSANGLSLLTRGRLNDGTTPSFSNVASIVAPFIALPLSECSTTLRPAKPSARLALRINSAASSADSAT